MQSLIHATAVAINGHAALMTGPPGAGKSDLALRLIDRGAELIGDDALIFEDGIVTGPERLRGLLEVRGIGPVTIEKWIASAPLVLEIALVAREAVVRLPEPAQGAYGCPKISLHPFEASAPIKVELALALAVERRAQSTESTVTGRDATAI